MSQRNYPLNAWWVAASAEEVTRQPLSRWLMERRVVLYRTANGLPVALDDRCAHRWAPLSQGKLLGDEIVCPYHGFRYNADGKCTLVPTQSQVPSALKVNSYPVLEYGSYVWIWFGDPTKADFDLLPRIPWFTDSKFLQLRLYYDLKCNYMLLQENVLDLTHVPHLHGQVQLEGWDSPVLEVKATEREVTYEQRVLDVPAYPSQAATMCIEAGRRLTRSDWGTFACPSFHYSGSDFEDPSPPEGGRRKYAFRGLHLTTPISPTRTHYWAAVAQDYGHSVPDLMQQFYALLDLTAKQDQTLLEDLQVTIGRDLRGSDVPEVLLASDRAPVIARRILKRMLDAEQSLGSS